MSRRVWATKLVCLHSGRSCHQTGVGRWWWTILWCGRWLPYGVVAIEATQGQRCLVMAWMGDHSVWSIDSSQTSKWLDSPSWMERPCSIRSPRQWLPNLPGAGHEEASLTRPNVGPTGWGLLFCIWISVGNSMWRLGRWTIEKWHVCGCKVGPKPRHAWWRPFWKRACGKGLGKPGLANAIFEEIV